MTRARKLSWRKKLLFSTITTVGFFLLLELALALFGVRPVTETRDPLVGFSQQIPLFEVVPDDQGKPVIRTAANKLVWFNDQQFPRAKPSGTKRVFCVGGSTTYGRPYWDTTSYCGWLREFLPLADSSTDWQVINAGGVSYASYRVANVMEELARHEPDLFIVYAAHNEFLERRTYAGMFDKSRAGISLTATLSHSRTWALMDRAVRMVRPARETPATDMLPGEVDEMLNHTVGPVDYHRDDRWRENVLHHYELNLERMVAIARQAGADVVFVLPASNERSCAPFKSEMGPPVSPPAQKEFRSLLRQAERETAKQQFDAALTHLTQAAKISPLHAGVHYQKGRALFALKRYDEAQLAFQTAIQEDVCPLRAVNEISVAIRRVAERKQVPVVDFAARLREECRRERQHSCLGDEYFLDHVHPTVDIHRRLALWIVDDLQRAKLAGGTALNDQQIAAVRTRIEGRIDRTAHGIALRNLAKVLHWAGKFDEAAPRASDALQLIEHDLASRFVLADCLRHLGRTEEAIVEFEKLMETDPDYANAYLPFGLALAEADDLIAAKLYLAMGVSAYPDRGDAHYYLGLVHLRLKEFDMAVETLQKASRLQPQDLEIKTHWARAKAEAGQRDEAIMMLQQLLTESPEHATAHNQLGWILLQQGKRAEAINHFRDALRADPNHADARINLELAEAM